MLIIFQINFKKKIMPLIEKPKEEAKRWEEIKGKIKFDFNLDL
jgi:hypothetical protein